MSRHRRRTYSRFARIVKRRLAELLAPTVEEGLSEHDVSTIQKRQRSKTGQLIALGAVGLAPDYSTNRGRGAHTPGRTIRKSTLPNDRS
jgi:hypothetical protein